MGRPALGIDRYIVNPETGCWEWTGGRSQGYAWNKRGGVHRQMYLREVGPIPEGTQLDHLCRVRHCINPAHLEPVTREENLRRGLAFTHQAAKTHCPAGHPYASASVPGQRRACKVCKAAQMRALRTRRRAESSQPQPSPTR